MRIDRPTVEDVPSVWEGKPIFDSDSVNILGKLGCFTHSFEHGQVATAFPVSAHSHLSTITSHECPTVIFNHRKDLWFSERPISDPIRNTLVPNTIVS